MWQLQTQSLDHGLHFSLMRDGESLPYAEVIDLWCEDETFRTFFIGLLADSPFGAFRWETPPITSETQDREFEFVLLDCPGLDRPVDQQSFAQHFSQQQDVVTFANLRGDAVLVVPCPVDEVSAYGHLAAFVRQAPDRQVHRLWQAVGAAMQQRLSEQPVWLSIAGMGVSWLHVRLDQRPKYYGYAPFKRV